MYRGMHSSRKTTDAADGALGEHLSAMSAGQLGDLLVLLAATLQGRRPLPPSWKHADVTLIPKVAGALLAMQLPPPQTNNKQTQFFLSYKSSPCAYGCMLHYRDSHSANEGVIVFGLRLRPQSSRPSSDYSLKSEGHGGLPSFLAKLDITKAHDTVSWEALDWLFERRALPHQLRSMYARMNIERTLTSRVSGGAVAFNIRPERGMPQGAPESLAIYACLIEEVSLLAAAAAQTSDLPVPNPEEEATPFEVDRLQARPHLHRPAVLSFNFADDMHLLAASTRQVSYMVPSFAVGLSTAHQFLGAEKTAVLSYPQAQGRMRVWDKPEIQDFVHAGRRPPDDGVEDLGTSESVVVLGSCSSSDGSGDPSFTLCMEGLCRNPAAAPSVCPSKSVVGARNSLALQARSQAHSSFPDDSCGEVCAHVLKTCRDLGAVFPPPRESYPPLDHARHPRALGSDRNVQVSQFLRTCASTIR